MEQPCPRCGYVSDRPARFCRQCGAALFVETEAKTATTRNYPPNQAAQTYPNQRSPSPYGSSSGLDEQTPETTRFYRPPITPMTPNYGVPAPQKSNAGMWILIALLSFLLVGGGIAGMVFSSIRSQTQDSLPQEDIKDLEAQIEQQVQEQIRAAQQQQRQAEEMARDAREKAAQAGQPPPLPLPPPPPGAELPAGFEKYKYPNSEVQQQANVLGNEFAKMTTDDSVEQVVEFYRKLIGKPLTKGKDEEGAKYIFQVRGSPSTIIIVSPDEQNDGKTQIMFLRSGFQIPKVN
jgi:hypothetical protein